MASGGSDETTVVVRCVRCDEWEAYADVPLDSRITGSEDSADGQAEATCFACGEEFSVFYRFV